MTVNLDSVLQAHGVVAQQIYQRNGKWFQGLAMDGNDTRGWRLARSSSLVQRQPSKIMAWRPLNPVKEEKCLEDENHVEFEGG